MGQAKPMVTVSLEELNPAAWTVGNPEVGPDPPLFDRSLQMEIYAFRATTAQELPDDGLSHTKLTQLTPSAIPTSGV